MACKISCSCARSNIKKPNRLGTNLHGTNGKFIRERSNNRGDEFGSGGEDGINKLGMKSKLKGTSKVKEVMVDEN